MNKIINYTNITGIIDNIKRLNKKIVLVGGCFDILHFGHIRFLKEVKSFGDILIVALESDENVRRLKGENRPIQEQKERAEILSTLLVVDYVLLLPSMKSNEDYELLVKKISPDVIGLTAGDKYIKEKTKQASTIKARIEIVPKIQTHSTSELSKIIGLD